jgi:hypothetical protein
MTSFLEEDPGDDAPFDRFESVRAQPNAAAFGTKHD